MSCWALPMPLMEPVTWLAVHGQLFSDAPLLNAVLSPVPSCWTGCPGVEVQSESPAVSTQRFPSISKPPTTAAVEPTGSFAGQSAAAARGEPGGSVGAAAAADADAEVDAAPPVVVVEAGLDAAGVAVVGGAVVGGVVVVVEAGFAVVGGAVVG